jgi:hypothetical protein
VDKIGKRRDLTAVKSARPASSTLRAKKAQTHFSSSVGMRVTFQQQLGHPHLPVLSSHMERGKSFLRRNRDRQETGKPELTLLEKGNEASHLDQRGDAGKTKGTALSHLSERPKTSGIGKLPPSPPQAPSSLIRDKRSPCTVKCLLAC